MLDRLISGAGAVTDTADRVVRAIGRGGGESLLGRRPGSVIVAAICLVPRRDPRLRRHRGHRQPDGPDDDARTRSPSAGDLGSRTYATISGSIAATYVETYTDDNGNGTQEAGETGISWYYFLVDPETRSGVTIRSDDLAEGPVHLRGVRGRPRGRQLPQGRTSTSSPRRRTSLSFALDPSKFIDATAPVSDSAPLLDLAEAIPAAETAVRVAGSRAGGYLETCSDDVNGDGVCQPEEIDLWDVAVYDPATGAGIVVLVDENPEYTPATFTGMLRRDERDVERREDDRGFDFGTLGLDVSDTYLLDDGSAPTSAPLAFGLAALLGLLAGVILDRARRRLSRLPQVASPRCRNRRRPWPSASACRSGSPACCGRGAALIHVREADADLVRFQTAARRPARERPPMPRPTRSRRARAIEPSDRPPTAAGVTSTLIIERRGKPEGVAVGLGELVATVAGPGHAAPRRAARASGPPPAPGRCCSRSTPRRSATGRSAELLDETGLTAGESGSAHA